MKFLKKLDNKIKSFLEKQIEIQDKIILEQKDKQNEQRFENINFLTNLKPSSNKSIDVGLYFFDLHDLIKQKNEKTSLDYDLMDCYFVLGLATQGRIEEIKDSINDFKENEQDNLYNFFTTYKSQLMKMAKIAEQVENSDIGLDLKDDETIGQYTSRKLSKRKTFMSEFEFFKNLDLHIKLST